MNFVTRADGAQPVMFDMNAHLDLGADKPIFFPGWDKPTASSSQLMSQLGSLNIKPFAKEIRMVAMAMYLGTPVCLVGPQGCGKSTLLKALLGMTNWDVVITQASDTAELIDLMGIRMPDGQWLENGPLNAFRSGKVWMVEERDRFSASTATDLNAVLDRAPVRVPFLGEDALPHANFRVVGTANTVGNGDGIETHLASQIQTPAANRRWMFLKMGYMARDEERAVLLSRCPQLEQAPEITKALLEFADVTRQQDGFPAFSTAELAMCADLMQISDPTKYLATILDACYFDKLTSASKAAARILWDTAAGQLLAGMAASP